MFVMEGLWSLDKDLSSEWKKDSRNWGYFASIAVPRGMKVHFPLEFNPKYLQDTGITKMDLSQAN